MTKYTVYFLKWGYGSKATKYVCHSNAAARMAAKRLTYNPAVRHVMIFKEGDSQTARRWTRHSGWDYTNRQTLKTTEVTFEDL